MNLCSPPGIPRANPPRVDDARRTLSMLRLSLVRGLGNRTINALLCRFRTPEAILDCRREELEANGVPPEVGDDVLSPRSADRASEEWKKAETLGIRILDILHPDYPSLLREIFDPPAILYIRGKRWDSDLPASGDCGDPPADRLWHQLRRAIRGRPCGAGCCDHFGSGPRH